MKKNLLVALVCYVIAWSGISAQENVKSSGGMSIGLEFFSTTGVGLELATPLSSNFALRGGFSFLPISANVDFPVTVSGSILNDINEAINEKPQIREELNRLGLPTTAYDINTDVNTTLNLGFNGKALIDYYPSSKRSFHLTAGVYFGNGDLLTVKGKMQQAVDVLNVLRDNGVDFFEKPYIINEDIGYQISGKDIMDLRGSIKVNSVKPYFGLGFGRAVPKKRVNVSFEIGAFYQGTPKPASNNPNIQKLIDDNMADISGVLEKLSIYPVMSLKLNFRVF